MTAWAKFWAWLSDAREFGYVDEATLPEDMLRDIHTSGPSEIESAALIVKPVAQPEVKIPVKPEKLSLILAKPKAKNKRRSKKK